MRKILPRVPVMQRSGAVTHVADVSVCHEPFFQPPPPPPPPPQLPPLLLKLVAQKQYTACFSLFLLAI